MVATPNGVAPLLCERSEPKDGLIAAFGGDADYRFFVV